MVSRILLVDDEDDNLKSLIAAQPDGMQFIVVRDVHTAMYLLYEFDLEHGIDMVVCNQELRDGDVFFMLDEIKRDRTRMLMPIVFFQCMNQATTVHSYQPDQSNNADRCLSMPSFDAAVLCQEVRQILRSH